MKITCKRNSQIFCSGAFHDFINLASNFTCPCSWGRFAINTHSDTQDNLPVNINSVLKSHTRHWHYAWRCCFLKCVLLDAAHESEDKNAPITICNHCSHCPQILIHLTSLSFLRREIVLRLQALIIYSLDLVSKVRFNLDTSVTISMEKKSFVCYDLQY